MRNCFLKRYCLKGLYTKFGGGRIAFKAEILALGNHRTYWAPDTHTCTNLSNFFFHSYKFMPTLSILPVIWNLEMHFLNQSYSLCEKNSSLSQYFFFFSFSHKNISFLCFLRYSDLFHLTSYILDCKHYLWVLLYISCMTMTISRYLASYSA